MANQTQMNLSDVMTTVEFLQGTADGNETAALPLLKDLSARTLASEKTLQGRVTRARFTEILLRTLTIRFITQGRDVTEQQVARMISSAIRFQRKSIRDQTHYIPIHLEAIPSDETVDLGPVTFHPLATFAFTENAPDAITDWVGQADLIAEVTVPACEPNMSRLRAEQAVNRARDVIRFLAAEAGLAPPRPDGPPHKQSWSQIVTALPDGLLEKAGGCLRCLIEPESIWPLGERFLDAIGWYAMAAREPADAAAITLWVNALERLAMTKGHERITDCVARRTTLLLICADKALSYTDGRSLADKLYELRCGLVHGAVRPFAESLPTERIEAERITRQALQGSMTFFEEIGLHRTGITAKKLEKAYDTMEKRLQSG